MKSLLTAALLLLAGGAHAAGTGCQDTTGGLVLEKVRAGVVGTWPYGCINRSLDTLSSGSASTTTAAALSVSTAAIYAALQSTGSALTIETARAIAAEALKLPLTGGTLSGALTGTEYMAGDGSSASPVYRGTAGDSGLYFTSSGRYPSISADGIEAAVFGSGTAFIYTGLNVIDDNFSVGWTSFTVEGGSAAVAYSLTAGSFLGPLTGAASSNVLKAGDTMTGLLTVPNITVAGGVVSATGSFSGSMTASSGTFTATGDAQYSIRASSGIIIEDGYLVTKGIRYSGDDSISTTSVSGGGGGGGGGIVLQYISSMTTARFVLAAAIPADDSIPQISEGWQVLVATMTPINAASNIRISGVVNLGETTNNCNNGVVCVFKDTTANAIACWSFYTAGSPQFSSVPFFYTEAAANTTLRNYSLRAGCESANSITVNEQTGADVYGLRLTSYMEIAEIAGP